jgi:SWI/SNF-related matrix-associated actin-dependent regulator 1 of chromatin subfamily A
VELDAHQFEAAVWRLQNPKSFLADAPGVGKTAPDIVAASLSGKRLFVGCRAVARTNWKREAAMWWPELKEEDLLIQSHNTLAVNPKAVWDAKQFLAKGDAVIVIDEAHRVRNKETRTAQAFYGPKSDGRGGLIEGVDCVFPQSGTPAPTGAGDMWIHLHALRPDLITLPGSSAPLSYMQYIERYTNFSHTEYGIRFWSNKKEMLPELRAIFSEFILRRTEGTIKLPPLVFDSVIVDCPAAKEVLKELRELEASSSIRALAESLDSAEASGQEFTWSAPDAQLGELRRIIGEIKAPVIGRLIAEELDDDAYKKIVIFAYHHTVIEALYEQLIEFKPVVLTGKTPANKRQQIIDDFQENPSVRPFIGQIQACNESITLTAADQVAVVEDDWNPDTLVQAVKRLHRRGQKNTVYARVFALANSLDEGVVRVRTRKAKQTAEVL